MISRGCISWIINPSQELGNARGVERLCDSVVRLEAFEGSDKESNPLYKDYHGVCVCVYVRVCVCVMASPPSTLTTPLLHYI